MTAEQINHMILFTFNMVIMLCVCGVFTGLALIGTVIYELIMQKLNGDKVYITPLERANAERGISKVQHIRAKINGETIEITVSKKFMRWAFKNRFNYWIFIRYILFKAKAGKGL